MAISGIVVGFLACFLTSLSLGVMLCRVLRLDLRRAEAVCLGYMAGSVVTSTVVLAIAALRIAWPGVFLALAASSSILLWLNRHWLRGLKPAAFSTIPWAFRLLLYAALLAYGILYFRQAVSPEMSPDGMDYHLGLVNQWSHFHGLTRNIGMHATLPAGMEMLFLFAFAIGRHSAAALVHCSFLMMLPWLMVLYGCRFGWPRGAAVLAAVLVFASPLIGMDGSAAYNDVALAATVFALLFLFEIWKEERTDGLLVAASLLTGFALALKPTAVFLAAFAGGALIWELRRSPRRVAARNLLIAVIAAAAVPAPYFVRNSIWYQNPIAFFGNRVFPNRWFHVSFEESYALSQAHLNGVAWAEMPRELTFGGPKMQESFGPAFLLLPLALVALIWPRTRFLLLAALAVAAPFESVKSARFLIPAIPLMAMAAAFVLCRIPRTSLLAGAIALVHLFVSWPSFNNRYHFSTGWRLAWHVPWSAALRREPEEHYLQRSDQYRMARLVETNVPEGEPVLTLDASVAQAYTLRPIVVAWESAFGERMSDMILAAAYLPTNGGRTFTATFPKAAIRELRIAQMGHGAGQAMWSVNEIRIWSDGAPLPASPRWRWSAHPNPWDIALVSDGAPATRWRSWETLRPGMWIDVRFDRRQAIDRVDVIGYDPQWESRMAVSVLTVGGQWMPAGESHWSSDPPPDLRRQATQELKRAGVRFIEMRGEAWNREPFRGDCAGWGVHEVASTPQTVLLGVD